MGDDNVWQFWLVGLALVLILEGFLPFLSPLAWRKMMYSLVTQKDKTIRLVGFISMVSGVGLLYLVH